MQSLFRSFLTIKFSFVVVFVKRNTKTTYVNIAGEGRGGGGGGGKREGGKMHPVFTSFLKIKFCCCLCCCCCLAKHKNDNVNMERKQKCNHYSQVS